VRCRLAWPLNSVHYPVFPSYITHPPTDSNPGAPLMYCLCLSSMRCAEMLARKAARILNCRMQAVPPLRYSCLRGVSSNASGLTLCMCMRVHI